MSTTLPEHGTPDQVREQYAAPERVEMVRRAIYQKYGDEVSYQYARDFLLFIEAVLL